METYDTIVIGLGVAGSAAARELSARGRRVLGLDRRAPDHRTGSSHGESRLIRTVYFEAPHYVRLLRRAYRGWRQLEAATGTRLLRQTGALMIGPPGGELIVGCRKSVEAWDLDCEELSPEETGRRFPAFRPPEDHATLFDPRGGFLAAARCLEGLRETARRDGARLRFGEGARSWERSGDGISVRTTTGVYGADSLILAAGGWTRSLVEGRDLPLTVERQTVHFFRPPRAELFAPERFPVFIFEGGPGPREESTPLAYGVPRLREGVKVALHHGGETGDRPENVESRVHEDESRRAADAVRGLLPELGRDAVAARVCRYTNTPDEDFLLDRLADPSGSDAPGAPGPGPPVVVATGFSGHGFKFAMAAAQITADLVEGTEDRDEVSPFRLARFDGASS